MGWSWQHEQKNGGMPVLELVDIKKKNGIISHFIELTISQFGDSMIRKMTLLKKDNQRQEKLDALDKIKAGGIE